MHPSSPPPSGLSNPPPRRGPPNPLNPSQNRLSAPSTISHPVIDARVRRTFQGQVYRRIKDVQCFSCKELGYPSSTALLLMIMVLFTDVLAAMRCNLTSPARTGTGGSMTIGTINLKQSGAKVQSIVTSGALLFPNHRLLGSQVARVW
jgi:hypothetical protein